MPYLIAALIVAAPPALPDRDAALACAADRYAAARVAARAPDLTAAKGMGAISPTSTAARLRAQGDGWRARADSPLSRRAVLAAYADHRCDRTG